MATISEDRVVGAYRRHGLKRVDGWFSDWFESRRPLARRHEAPGCCPLGALLVDVLGVRAVRGYCRKGSAAIVPFAAAHLGVTTAYVYGFMEAIDRPDLDRPGPAYDLVAGALTAGPSADFDRGFDEAAALRAAVYRLPRAD